MNWSATTDGSMNRYQRLMLKYGNIRDDGIGKYGSDVLVSSSGETDSESCAREQNTLLSELYIIPHYERGPRGAKLPCRSA